MTLVQSIPQTTETTLEKVFIMTDHWLWEYNATNIRKTKVGIIFCHTLELCISRIKLTQKGTYCVLDNLSEQSVFICDSYHLSSCSLRRHTISYPRIAITTYR